MSTHLVLIFDSSKGSIPKINSDSATEDVGRRQRHWYYVVVFLVPQKTCEVSTSGVVCETRILTLSSELVYRLTELSVR